MSARYADEVRRLGAQPAHAGDPTPGPGSVVAGESAAPERGAWVRFAARIVDGTVEEARFRAWGCPHVLAACELAASRLEGHLLGGAQGLSAAALAPALDVPTEKWGRLLVIEDALAALAAAPATSK
jgi:NifU-like protein involved in Fe-S cluster formation